MEMKTFNVDFVQRTKQIINEYCNDSCKYEVTLLINCLLGLISLPTVNTGSDESVFIQEYIEKLSNLKAINRQSEEGKTFRSLKNALSHMYIEPRNEDGKINKIIFKDKIPGRDCFHTELEFTVESLREFALFVADKYLTKFDN